jgi:hypothetical protein
MKRDLFGFHYRKRELRFVARVCARADRFVALRALDARRDDNKALPELAKQPMDVFGIHP